MFSDPAVAKAMANCLTLSVAEACDVRVAETQDAIEPTLATVHTRPLLSQESRPSRKRKTKTRRGKKLRRTKSRDIYLDEVSDILGSIANKITCFQSENEDTGNAGASSEKEECSPTSMSTRCHRGKRFLRPTCIPNAPHNTTQFIMETHADDFHLPFNFEVANVNSDAENSDNDLPAYSDIDFAYDSPDDLDTQAFFEHDFEMVFQEERDHELSSRSKKQLIDDILGLRTYIDTVESVLHNSSPVQMRRDSEQVSTGFAEESSGDFSKLVSELCELRRENASLHAQNKLLSLKPRTESMHSRACEM